MITVKPFKAVRPAGELAEKIAALPYDVYSTEEAREIGNKNKYSFLHVDKAEIDLDEGVDLYDAKVYNKAASNLKAMLDDGQLIRDEKEMLYVYRLEMDGRCQTGIVGLTSIDEYVSGTIKKHEFTRKDKEDDRIRHIKACDAQTGPIFMVHKPLKGIKAVINDVTAKNPPVYEMAFDDGTKNSVWLINGEDNIQAVVSEFATLDNLFIADGHHRNAAAVNVGLEKRSNNPNHRGDEEYNYYLSVMFPEDELFIMDYNRVIKDLNGLSEDEFLAAISEKFTLGSAHGQSKPQKRHEIFMYISGKWHKLNVKPELVNEDSVLESLDVSILQELVLTPVLGIKDVRRDKRIDFIGGIRGVSEIEKRVDSGEMKVGFLMYPTQMSELMGVALKDEIMPPKSTWFEPKLRSGIFIHEI